MRRLPAPFRPALSAPTAEKRLTVANVFLNSKATDKATGPNLYSTMAKVNAINKLASSSNALQNVLEPKRFTNDLGERVGFIASKDVQAGGVRAQAIAACTWATTQCCSATLLRAPCGTTSNQKHVWDPIRSPLQVILSIPEDMAVTCLDAEKQELIGSIASEQGCGELVALTLWLIAERAKGTASPYAALVATLPVCAHGEMRNQLQL